MEDSSGVTIETGAGLRYVIDEPDVSRGRVHEALDGAGAALSELQSRLDNLFRRLEPVLRTVPEDPGEIRSGVPRDVCSSLADRIIELKLSIDSVVENVGATLDRLEV